jgi:hypothetical protein
MLEITDPTLICRHGSLLRGNETSLRFARVASVTID